VDPVAGQPRQVRVRPGLALDPLGRAVVLANNRFVDVPNQLARTSLEGYYLALRYDEEPVPAGDQGCSTPTGTPEPARIRETPALYWTEEYPDHRRCGSRGHWADCAIVLAVVRLTAGCTVEAVETDVRQYAAPTHTSRVQAFALEGEKDVDKDNPKVLHFQIRGGTPTSVVLHLWGALFSSLHYSELAGHLHEFRNGQISAERLTDHTHEATHGHGYDPADTTTAADNEHGHRLMTQLHVYGNPPIPHTGQPPYAVMTHDPDTSEHGYEEHGYTLRGGFEDPLGPFVEPGGRHDHQLPSIKTTTSRVGLPIVELPASPTHTHSVSGDLSSTGVSGVQPRTGVAYTYLDNLRVRLLRPGLTTPLDITQAIVRHLSGNWNGTLGDGSSGHAINGPDGTGAIDLLDLGIPFGEGPYTLEFSVKSGGGKVLYNVYVS
jgi:hypothetical protein